MRTSSETICAPFYSSPCRVALKPLHRVGHGPPSIVCNWTDRVAQCALALSKDGVFFSCMSRDMMEQTSLTHIVDVMALLHSLKLFMDSYCQMHQEQFADSINIELFASFFKQLVGCKHYVVTMFTLRWLYESIDYFSAAHRVAIFATLISWDLLDNTFCHWEPAIRHLTHNLILYRLVPSAHRENQQELFESLGTGHAAHLLSRRTSYTLLPPCSKLSP